jgi:ABC-type lipoprotein export system ATPase subunit
MIRFDNITIRLNTFCLEQVNFKVPTGTYAVLMGRTGCGKTTILEAACGLRPIEQGRVFLMDRDVTMLAPGRRNIGFVPQDGALFPSMTVGQHLGFALRVRRWPSSKVAARVGELAEWLNIGHLLKRRPQGLSGGERQRVAMGRALAAPPAVVCLDDPREGEPAERFIEWLESANAELPGLPTEMRERAAWAVHMGFHALAGAYLQARWAQLKEVADFHDSIAMQLVGVPRRRINVYEVRRAVEPAIRLCRDTQQLMRRLRPHLDHEACEPVDTLIRMATELESAFHALSR